MQCIGVDLGTRSSAIAMLTESGEVEAEASVRTTRSAIRRFFSGQEASCVVMEATGVSPWVSRELADLGHEVIVLNPRRARVIADSTLKTDRLDAEVLARLGRLARQDSKLLNRVKHRREDTQKLRAVFRMRSQLVESRTSQVNCARGLARSLGHPLPSCTTKSLPDHVRMSKKVPEDVKELLQPLLETIAHLSESITELDAQLTRVAEEQPVVERLRSIPGVGVLTALYFVLCIDDPTRFKKSRDVGPYLGLRPKLRESSQSSRRGGITRAGDAEMRRLLTQASHALMRTKSPDALKDWAEQLMRRSNRKTAVTAVSRKLAVLMHALWTSGEAYDGSRAKRQQRSQDQRAATLNP